jgi:hypothetical protein
LSAAFLTVTLGACAGSPARVASEREYTHHYEAQYDAEKVVIVNQWAETHGAHVLWINYPTKPRARDKAD